MPNEPEKLWDYGAVAIGQTRTKTPGNVTIDTLREYAQTQHIRGSELDQTSDSTHPAEVPTMPSMVLAYAPLLRSDLAENNGEWRSKTPRPRVARRRLPSATFGGRRMSGRGHLKPPPYGGVGHRSYAKRIWRGICVD